MGDTHSREAQLDRSPKRWSFRRISCAARPSRFRPKTVVVFSQCTTDFALQCAVKLIEITDCMARVHASTDDYNNVKRLGDEILLKHLNKDLFLHKVDLRSEQATKEALLEILDMEGSIDVLVCHVDEMNGFVGDFDEAMLTGAFEALFFPSLNLLKGIIPIFKKQKYGKVIFVNSIAGIIGLPMHSVYCSAKFAVEGLLESLASECMEHGIKYTVIQTTLEESAPSSKLHPNLHWKLSDNNNVKLKEKFARTLETLQEKQLLKCVNVRKVARTITEIIYANEPYFRYTTNKKCAYLIGEKFLDSRGTNSIKEVSKFCLNLDLDDVR